MEKEKIVDESIGNRMLRTPEARTGDQVGETDHVERVTTEHTTVDGERPRVGRCNHSGEILISGPGHHDLF